MSNQDIEVEPLTTGQALDVAEALAQATSGYVSEQTGMLIARNLAMEFGTEQPFVNAFMSRFRDYFWVPGR